MQAYVGDVVRYVGLDSPVRGVVKEVKGDKIKVSWRKNFGEYLWVNPIVSTSDIVIVKSAINNI
jgi:hypothetical protein